MSCALDECDELVRQLTDALHDMGAHRCADEVDDISLNRHLRFTQQRLQESKDSLHVANETIAQLQDDIGEYKRALEIISHVHHEQQVELASLRQRVGGMEPLERALQSERTTADELREANEKLRTQIDEMVDIMRTAVREQEEERLEYDATMAGLEKENEGLRQLLAAASPEALAEYDAQQGGAEVGLETVPQEGEEVEAEGDAGGAAIARNGARGEVIYAGEEEAWGEPTPALQRVSVGSSIE